MQDILTKYKASLHKSYIKLFAVRISPYTTLLIIIIFIQKNIKRHTIVSWPKMFAIPVIATYKHFLWNRVNLCSTLDLIQVLFLNLVALQHCNRYWIWKWRFVWFWFDILPNHRFRTYTKQWVRFCTWSNTNPRKFRLVHVFVLMHYRLTHISQQLGMLPILRPPLLNDYLYLLPSWKSNHMPDKCVSHLHIPNCNSHADENLGWTYNVISHLMTNVITYPCWS